MITPEELFTCSICGMELKAKHWGAVYKKETKEMWCCENITCLVEFDKRRKDWLESLNQSLTTAEESIKKLK